MEEATRMDIEIAPGKTISLETGRLAKQANGAVVVRQGETMVLCTAVMSNKVKEGQSWFPLTVDYREKFSAGGKIPGGFIKREGRPTDKEVLSSRLVDRAIRAVKIAIWTSGAPVSSAFFPYFSTRFCFSSVVIM